MMINSTEHTSRWARGRRLAIAGIAGVVLLGGGAGLAYAADQDTTGPTFGYGTVVDESDAPVQNWPSQTEDRKRSDGTWSGSARTDGPSPSGIEDCPGWDGGSSGSSGGESDPDATPSDPAEPATPDGDQL
jgi:hypothetical protein